MPFHVSNMAAGYEIVTMVGALNQQMAAVTDRKTLQIRRIVVVIEIVVKMVIEYFVYTSKAIINAQAKSNDHCRYCG